MTANLSMEMLHNAANLLSNLLATLESQCRVLSISQVIKNFSLNINARSLCIWLIKNNRKISHIGMCKSLVKYLTKSV